MTADLQTRSGVAVELASIMPRKGALDGSRILVADHSTDEERPFLVAYRFGHTVQWNISAELRPLDLPQRSVGLRASGSRPAGQSTSAKWGRWDSNPGPTD